MGEEEATITWAHCMPSSAKVFHAPKTKTISSVNWKLVHLQGNRKSNIKPVYVTDLVPVF